MILSNSRILNVLLSNKKNQTIKTACDKERFEKLFVKWLLNEQQIKWCKSKYIEMNINHNSIFFLTELKQGDRWNIFDDMHMYIKQKVNIYTLSDVKVRSKYWSLKATNNNKTLLKEKTRNNSFLNTFISGNFVPSFNGLLINAVINEAFILKLHHKIYLKPYTVIP